MPILIVRDLFVLDKDKLKTIYQKLGNGIPQNNQPTVWMHGVSLGEVKILSPLAKKLESKGLKILITSTTNTGLKQIQNTFSNSNISVLPFPYDLSFAHQKIIKNFKVEKIILFESEFWPNLINSARDTKLVSLNTTISDGSFERFKHMLELLENRNNHYIKGYISCIGECPYEGDVPIKDILLTIKKFDELGVDEICIADTIGTLKPNKLKNILGESKIFYDHDKLSLHLHLQVKSFSSTNEALVPSESQ